jgi:hypothetical protein
VTEEATALSRARKSKPALRSRHGSSGKAEDVLPKEEAQSKAEFSPNLATYQCTVNINQLGTYVVITSFVVTLGGRPLSDIKYGVIIVPVGEESVVIGRQPTDAFIRTYQDRQGRKCCILG